MRHPVFRCPGTETAGRAKKMLFEKTAEIIKIRKTDGLRDFCDGVGSLGEEPCCLVQPKSDQILSRCGAEQFPKALPKILVAEAVVCGQGSCIQRWVAKIPHQPIPHVKKRYVAGALIVLGVSLLLHQRQNLVGNGKGHTVGCFVIQVFVLEKFSEEEEKTGIIGAIHQLRRDRLIGGEDKTDRAAGCNLLDSISVVGVDGENVILFDWKYTGGKGVVIVPLHLIGNDAVPSGRLVGPDRLVFLKGIDAYKIKNVDAHISQ